MKNLNILIVKFFFVLCFFGISKTTKASIFGSNNDYTHVSPKSNSSVFCGYTIMDKIGKSFSKADCRGIVRYFPNRFDSGWRGRITGYDSYPRDSDTLMINFESCSSSRQGRLTVAHAMNTLIKRGYCSEVSRNAITVYISEVKK